MLPKSDDPSVYLSARDKYNPEAVNKGIKFLLVAESPPANGGYFYFEKAMGRGNLFRETMRALEIPWAKCIRAMTKVLILGNFKPAVSS